MKVFSGSFFFRLVVLLFIGFLIATAGVSLTLPQAAEAQSGGGLFSEPRGLSLHRLQKAGDPTLLRSRTVSINFGQLGSGSMSKQVTADRGNGVTLNLFPGTVYTAVLERVEINGDRGYSWIGKVDGDPYSLVLLVVNEGLMMGEIVTGGELYQIRNRSGDLHLIEQIDQSALPSEASPRERSAAREDLANETRQALTDDGSVIDILVAYTAAAGSDAGGTAAMEALIDEFIAYTNQSYRNSGIGQRLNLVHSYEVQYNQVGDLGVDLDRLSNIDGAMDEVHTLRDTYGADIVTLIVDDLTNACGVAWQMEDTVFAAGNAFSVVVDECGSRVFAHELGHTMGANHDRYATPQPGFAEYSHGYVSKPGAWTTIMAYFDECMDNNLSCRGLPYWSNPDLNYEGAPMGIRAGKRDAADNRKTLNETAFYVANHRQRPAGQPRSLTVSTGGAGQGRVSSSPIGINCGSVCSLLFANGARVSLTATPLPGSAFAGWSGGGCSGMGTCTVSMNKNMSVSATFTAGKTADILLVDDDNNGPDVRHYYSDALSALGVSFDVWDTVATDVEPDAALLNNYKTVIWFSGQLYGGSAGPGAAAEAALGAWLDQGNCFLISSQDYHYDRGLTPFMSNHLGAAAVMDDAGGFNRVTGRGTLFGGLGPYDLTHFSASFSDIVTPAAPAKMAFSGNNNGAAVYKDNGVYKTTYLAFPFEALATDADRTNVLGSFVNACQNNNALVTQEIQLNSGWNVLSSNVYPQNPDMWAVFEQLIDDLVMCKDDDGNVFWPQPPFGVNEIGRWDASQTYQCYMERRGTLSITGAKVMP